MQHSIVYDFYSMQLYPFMWSLGGQAWDPSNPHHGRCSSTLVNAEAMEWNRRMLRLHAAERRRALGIGENVDAFTQGKAAARRCSWAAVGLSMVTDENRDVVAIVPPPAFVREDGSSSRVRLDGGQPWVLNAFNPADKMRVAVDFLNWWYLPETAARICPSWRQPDSGSDAERSLVRRHRPVEPCVQVHAAERPRTGLLA
jgi:multiple sugar transport system substrate-binding protein